MARPDPLEEVRQRLLEAVTDPDSASYPGDMAHDLLDAVARMSDRHPIGHRCRACVELRRSEGLGPDGWPTHEQD